MCDENMKDPASLPCGISNGSNGSEDSCQARSSKIRRIETKTKEWTQKFYGVDNNESVECKFSTSFDLDCGIMHELTQHVVIEDLPPGWPCVQCGDANADCAADDMHANTVHMPCGHVFSPSALVLHFLMQDMRCPICRTGHPTRMSITCVPPSIRHHYAEKIASTATTESTDLEISVEDIINVVSQVDLQVLIRAPRNARASRSSARSTSETLMYSRLMANVADVTAHIERVERRAHDGVQDATRQMGGAVEDTAAGAVGSASQQRMATFQTHRSFQRTLQIMMERQIPSATVVFMLRHPLFSLDIRSVEINVENLCKSLFDQTSRGSVPLTCTAISGIEPIAYVQTSHDPASGMSDLTVAMNLSVIVSMATYVSQVLEQLEIAGQEQLLLAV